MAYRVYPANGAPPRRVRDEEDERSPGREKRPPPDAVPGAASPPFAGLDGLFRRLEPARLQAEDLLILAILYLLYRESGDREFLLAAAAYIFL